MKCPVCKTECGDGGVCPECGFEELNPTFLSKEEGEAWIENVIWPWRRQYWERLKEFEIKDTRLVNIHVSNEISNDVTIPFGITSIESFAFSNCGNVQTVWIPNSVTRIKAWAFESWKGEIQRIILPASVAVLNANFSGNVKEILLPQRSNNYYIKNMCLIDRTTKTVIAVCNKAVTQIAIPNGVERIGEYAFRDCSQLTEVIVPENIKYIEAMAFDGCSKLSSISLSDPEIIEENAFAGTPKRNITISTMSHKYHIENSCLIEQTSMGLISCGDTACQKIEVPSGINWIGNYAFQSCECLKEILLPESVTAIGERAFSGCKSLSAIVLPPNVVSIGSGAFSGCSSLKKVVLPHGLKYIFSNAFSYCDSIEYIIIPDSVSFYAFPFSACHNIKGIFCDASKPHDDWCIEEYNGFKSPPIFYSGTWHYDENGEPVPND